MKRWRDYPDPKPVTPQSDTWYGDDDVFANYGGYDGEEEGNDELG